MYLEEMNVVENENDLVLDANHLKREFIAGGAAGAVGIFVGFPFDLIKVNMQCHSDQYRNSWQCFRSIIGESGFKGLFRGCLPPVVTQGAINSLLFAGESTAMKLLQPELKRGEIGTPFNTILAGCIGGITQCTMLVPSDVIKCTMQSGSSNGTGAGRGALRETIECAKNIFNTEGVRGFYKGWTVTIAREVPSIGTYFFAYKNIREKIWKYQGYDQPSTSSTLIAGGMAGALSWTIVYPTDVIKTNMQISTVPVGNNALAYKDMSVVRVAQCLFRQHGLSVFFRGLGPTILRAFPANASTFYIYELLKDKLHYV